MLGNSQPMVEVWRGGVLESVHSGHAVICDASGAIVEAWGEPETVIFPRSSCKILQALPLVESGAADAAHLGTDRLALACASHKGAAIHTDRVTKWLSDIGLSESDLRCGPQWPDDIDARNGLIKTDDSPCQIHNNCSGKHSGFLTLSKHLGAGPEYVKPDHPVQKAVREAFEDMTGEASPGYGIDGCSAPNFATSVHGLARAMARIAASREDGSSVRERASARLAAAMRLHPELVSGETGASTRLMRATEGRVAVKSGAEAVFVAILPERKLGVALKIVDGGSRGSETAIAALLVKLGVLDPGHPVARSLLNAPLLNRRNIDCGVVRTAPGFA